MSKNQLIHGDCLEVLKTIPDESVHSCVSDVPYGLGNREPRPEEILAYLQGETSLNTGGDFMGKDWEIPSVSVWKEIYRILKPGAYLAIFGGTRTFDLISMGLRMAGFICRDSIVHEFPQVNLPLLYWVYASGMPKSRNIGKALAQKHPEGDFSHLGELGTGLKPAAEPILLFRKPFKGTVDTNVLAHGTGALNIGATRVQHASKEDFETHKAQVEAVRAKGGVREDSWKNASDLSGANEVTAAGRWPANFVLSHAPDCKQVGTQTIAPHPQGPDRFQKTSGGTFSEAYGNQTAEDKPDVAPIWQCVDGCPVRTLDEQSGDCPSTLTGRADPNTAHTHPGTVLNPNSTFLGERTHLSKVYADAGGASRFFTQFECVDGCPVRELDTQSGTTQSNPREGDGEYLTSSTEDWRFKRASGGYTDEGGASRFFQMFDGVTFRYVPKANRKAAGMGVFKVEHPTIKPLALMRWLVKLTTVRGGTVLDPYCGSGSTLHAAVEEDCFYIGIERDLHSYEEASRRMDLVHKSKQRYQTLETLFELSDEELESRMSGGLS